MTCSKKFADDPALGVKHILFPKDEEYEVLAVNDLLYIDYGKVVLKIEDQITVTDDLQSALANKTCPLYEDNAPIFQGNIIETLNTIGSSAITFRTFDE